jgi:hypothetical protein
MLDDGVLATAKLSRLLFRCEVISLTGKKAIEWRIGKQYFIANKGDILL